MLSPMLSLLVTRFEMHFGRRPVSDHPLLSVGVPIPACRHTFTTFAGTHPKVVLRSLPILAMRISLDRGIPAETNRHGFNVTKGLQHLFILSRMPQVNDGSLRKVRHPSTHRFKAKMRCRFAFMSAQSVLANILSFLNLRHLHSFFHHTPFEPPKPSPSPKPCPAIETW